MTPREREAEYQCRYRAKNREKLAEAQRGYHANNREKEAERQRKYYVKCREKVNEAQRRYRAGNRTKMAECAHRYIGTIVGSLRKRFSGIKQRCNNPNAKNYERYGGRGIKCMFKDSDAFVDYVINILKVDPRGLQIDRTENDGHYEPGNIRFVTPKINANNRRNSKK